MACVRVRPARALLVDKDLAGGLSVADTNGRRHLLTRERRVFSGEAILVQNRTPPGWAYVSESNLLARETGEPLLLLDKHYRAAGVGVAVGFTREHGTSLGDALLGKESPRQAATLLYNFFFLLHETYRLTV
uniref:Uncharacterized protein n=1 Tax=Oryza glumipatula TaxID=40148 RepID=A0A0E0ARN3_9ORYZ